jgi:ferric-dicitrate binding protein FerR (iron transport regulator)
MSIGPALLAMTLLASGGAAAQAAAGAKAAPPAALATVELVQLTASVERGKQLVPLGPGTELREGDRLNTGARSRLLLKLADGSYVSMGENGSLFFDRMQEHNGVFDASLFVAEGAIRFSAGVIGKFAGKRELSVAVNNVATTVRGTDFWGRSSPQSDIVCVIEGKVEVTPPGEQPFTLDEPLTYYMLEGNVSRPVARASVEQFKEWAAQTAEQEGKGIASRGGRWQITVASPKKFREAFAVYDALRRAGHAAEIVPAKAGEERVYGVRLANFQTEKDAKAVVEALKGNAQLAKFQYKVGM